MSRNVSLLRVTITKCIWLRAVHSVLRTNTLMETSDTLGTLGERA